MKQKIGIYICQCGSNISDYVDVDKVKEVVENLEGVSLAKITMFACSDSTQNEMVEDIKTNGLDGLVVASCSPKLHVPTFRNVATRAGMNQYNYAQVNIREQGSWAHSDNPAKATEKAIQLIKAGVTKVKHSKALEPLKIASTKAVAVIGAGIAGMRAAIELADMGEEVYLIEKDFFVGGRTPQWEDLCTVDDSASGIITRLYEDLLKHDNITLYTGAEATEMKGSVGNYEIKLKVKPRYVGPDYDQAAIDELIQKCKVEVPDEFNYGLTTRKVVYKKYPGAHPDIPAIELDQAGEDRELINSYAKHLQLDQKEQTVSLSVGAVMLNTGFDSYTPEQGEYGYGEFENVITFPEYKRLIELSGDRLVYKGKEIKTVGYIYCVGSCQPEGNTYCSRFCCTCGIATALNVRERFQDIQTLHVYKHIRTYGKQEVLYEKANREGDIFFKFEEEENPEVEQINGKTAIRFNDQLTDGEELALMPDLIVLLTGMVPRENSQSVADVFKAPLGRDRFFNEVHPKLRPVETVIDGVFISGTCQGPKGISESVKSSLSAASKANALLNKGEIELEPTLAYINGPACTACGDCIPVCPFNAISMTEKDGKQLAQVEKSTCKGCGMCLPVCPEDAIELAGYTNIEIEGMIASLTD